MVCGTERNSSPASLGIILGSLDATKHARVDWNSLDILARRPVEFCLGDFGSGSAEKEDGVKVFHPTNPVLTSWVSLLSAISSSQDKALKQIPFNLWIGHSKEEAGNRRCN